MPLFGEREGLGGTSSLGLVRSFARFSRASGFENDENIANYRELIKNTQIFFLGTASQCLKYLVLFYSSR